MQTNSASAFLAANLEQLAWVVNDINAAEKYFVNTLGVRQFVKLENVRSEDTQGTYSGKAGNFCFHLYLAYLGNMMVELIQPISGQSIYTDFLKKRPEGGVH